MYPSSDNCLCWKSDGSSDEAPNRELFYLLLKQKSPTSQHCPLAKRVYSSTNPSTINTIDINNTFIIHIIVSTSINIMGSKISVPSQPQAGTEAGALQATGHNSDHHQQSATTASRIASHHNNLISDTTSAAGRFNNSPNTHLVASSNSQSNSSSSNSLGVPRGATTAAILMRTYNPSSGIASWLTSTNGREAALVASTSSSPDASTVRHLDQINSYIDIFAQRVYPPQCGFNANDLYLCPVCNRIIVIEDIERHLAACLPKTNRISYNEDILTINKGECVICLDDLKEGDGIARLPCLCIYHKKCIDQWFEVNRSCPEHPSD